MKLKNKILTEQFYTRKALGTLFSASFFLLIGAAGCGGSWLTPPEKLSVETPAKGPHSVRDTLLLSQLAALLLDIQEARKTGFNFCEVKGEFGDLPNFSRMGEKVETVVPSYILKDDEADESGFEQGKKKVIQTKKFLRTMEIFKEIFKSAKEIIDTAGRELTDDLSDKWLEWSKNPENFHSWMMGPEVLGKVDAEDVTRFQLHVGRFKYIKKLVDPSCKIKGLEDYSPDPKTKYIDVKAAAKADIVPKRVKPEKQPQQPQKDPEFEAGLDFEKLGLVRDVVKIIMVESKKGDDSDDEKIKRAVDSLLKRTDDVLERVYLAVSDNVDAAKKLYLAVLAVIEADLEKASGKDGIGRNFPTENLQLDRLVNVIKPTFMLGKMPHQLGYFMYLVFQKWDALNDNEKASKKNSFKNLVVLYVPLLKRLAKEDKKAWENDVDAGVKAIGRELFYTKGSFAKREIDTTREVLLGNDTTRY